MLPYAASLRSALIIHLHEISAMLPYNFVLKSIVSILRNHLLIDGLRKISLLFLLSPQFILLGSVRCLQLFDFSALYKFEGVIQIAEVVS